MAEFKSFSIVDADDVKCQRLQIEAQKKKVQEEAEMALKCFTQRHRDTNIYGWR